MIERTFVIIKPDAVARGLVGKIISRFEDKCLEIVFMSTRYKNKDWCKEHYCRLPTDIYKKMEEYIVGRRLVGIVLEGVNTVEVVRNMVGCTNSLEAEPGTIRGDYGTYPIRCNIVHAADSMLNADIETKLFFNRDNDE